jgi:ATP synthase protein I
LLGRLPEIRIIQEKAQEGASDIMKKETKRYLKELAYYSSIGLSVALSIFIGLFVGVYLDSKFDTSPWLTLIGLFLGIMAGYRNIGIAIRKSRKL